MIKYSEWNQKLVESNETEIFHLTNGCLSTCDIYEYSAQLLVEQAMPAPQLQNSILTIGFAFKSGRHELKEQAYSSLKYSDIFPQKSISIFST